MFKMKSDVFKNYTTLGKFIITIVIIITMIGLSACSATEASSTDEKTELLVYSGAGLKAAMEDIKTAYESEHNVVIEYVYAGSTQLISQIELSGKGDVFIVGSEAAYTTMAEKNLVGEEYLVAYHTPCIGVPKGNPSGITSLEDMTQEGVRVILGDPDANAIGKTAQKIIEKNGLEAIYENVVSYSATVNEIVMQLSVNQADAAIVTIDNVYNNDDIEIIEIPGAENIDQKIPVCTLTYSENADEAQAFVEFISSEEGKEIFKENGFKPVE